MTDARVDCTVLPPELVLAYARGALEADQEWSVDAHVPQCPGCRAVLAGVGDPARLARNRSVMLSRASLPRPAAFGRLLRACGVPEHVWLLLQATPSLRRSFLAGVVAVLGVVVAASQLAVFPGHQAPGLAGSGGWPDLVPYVVVTPLLPLAAVAAAFGPRLDPAWALVSAAPVSKVWLLCVRTAAVVAASLVPASLAALALPARHWLAAAVLLPALAVCAVALGLATMIRPALAVAAASAGWTVLVIAVTVMAGQPTRVVGAGGQLIASGLVVAGCIVIAIRRNAIDYGWMG
jgi:hypothetical protein